MQAKELMVSPVFSVQPDASLKDAAKLMLEKGIGGVPVVTKDNELCGILTESDFAAKEKRVPFTSLREPQVFGEWLEPGKAEAIYEKVGTSPVKDYMNTEPFSVGPNDPIESVIQVMLENSINRVPVVEDKKLVGIIARRDLLKIMLR